MMTPSSTEVPRLRRARRGLLLPWLLLSFLASSLSAQGGGGPGPAGGDQGQSNDPSTSASSPGEEVTSLPVVDGTSGFTLLGSPRQMRAVVTEVNGVGTIDVRRIGPGQVAVTFVGDYRIVMDRSALARSSLLVLFRGGAPYQGGYALLTLGGSTTRLPSERVPLPIVRLAGASRAQGRLLTLAVFGRGQRSHLMADFGTGVVTLFQRATP